MNRCDILISDLCNEIDYFKSEAEYWKKNYEEEIRKSSIRLNEDLKNAKIGVANALAFALSVQDNPDGSLSISKENRKELTKTFKTK